MVLVCIPVLPEVFQDDGIRSPVLLVHRGAGSRSLVSFEVFQDDGSHSPVLLVHMDAGSRSPVLPEVFQGAGSHNLVSSVAGRDAENRNQVSSEVCCPVCTCFGKTGAGSYC